MSSDAITTIKRWPSKGRPDDIDYVNLDWEDKHIVTYHLTIAGRIQMWRQIQNWLIDQIYYKKSVYKDYKYIPIDRQTNHVLTKYLFLDQMRIANDDDYIALLNWYLEDLLLEELTEKRFNHIRVYYYHSEKPDEFKFSHFNKEQWSLSSEPIMTSDDMKVIDKYKQEYLVFLNECLLMLLRFKKDPHFGHRYSEPKKMIKRISECFGLSETRKLHHKSSKGERACQEVLVELGLFFEREVILDSLPNSRFDFRFSHNGKKYMLEYDGIQHFEYNSFFHNNDEENLKKQKERDIMKMQHALAAGYYFIRIDYTQYDFVSHHIRKALEMMSDNSRIYLSSFSLYEEISDGLKN